MMMDRRSVNFSESTFMQSDEKLNTGSVLPGLSLEAASLTTLGVTLATSSRLYSPTLSSTFYGQVLILIGIIGLEDSTNHSHSLYS